MCAAIENVHHRNGQEVGVRPARWMEQTEALAAAFGCSHTGRRSRPAWNLLGVPSLQQKPVPGIPADTHQQ